MPISYIELTLLLACTSRLRLPKQNVSLPGRPLPLVSDMSSPPSGTFVQPLALAITMPGSCVVPTATCISRLTVSSSGFRVNLGMPRSRVFSAPPMAGGFVGFTIWLVPFRPLCLHDVGAAPHSCARRSSRKSEIKTSLRLIAGCIQSCRPKSEATRGSQSSPCRARPTA